MNPDGPAPGRHRPIRVKRRVRQLGFESGKVIRRRASTALKNLPDALD
ncbi:MAG: hypothetical protein V3T44_02935 [bacterium]